MSMMMMMMMRIQVMTAAVLPRHMIFSETDGDDYDDDAEDDYDNTHNANVNA